MKGFRGIRFLAFVLVATLPPALAAGKTAKDPLCVPLRKFVSSVSPGDTKSIELHTSWGRGFKGEPGNSFASKECDHFGYAPGQATCKYLFEHSSIEFPGINTLRAISCLSGVDVRTPVRLHRVDMDLTYGSDQRGSNVTISLDEDQRMGGMVMKITAEGY